MHYIHVSCSINDEHYLSQYAEISTLNNHKVAFFSGNLFENVWLEFSISPEKGEGSMLISLERNEKKICLFDRVGSIYGSYNFVNTLYGQNLDIFLTINKTHSNKIPVLGKQRVLNLSQIRTFNN